MRLVIITAVGIAVLALLLLAMKRRAQPIEASAVLAETFE